MTAQEALYWINGLKNSDDTSPVLDYRDEISSALTLLAKVEGGEFVVVPRVASEKMLNAAMKQRYHNSAAYLCGEKISGVDGCQRIYTAMISAAGDAASLCQSFNNPRRAVHGN